MCRNGSCFTTRLDILSSVFIDFLFLALLGCEQENSLVRLVGERFSCRFLALPLLLPI